MFTPDRVKEMLHELKALLEKVHAGQDEQARVLQRELDELEPATNRL